MARYVFNDFKKKMDCFFEKTKINNNNKDMLINIRYWVVLATTSLLLLFNNQLLAETYTIDLSLPETNVNVTKDSDGFALFSGDSIHYLYPEGAPDLPSFVFHVSIPPQSNSDSLEVVIKSPPVYEKIPGLWDIRPVPEFIPFHKTSFQPKGTANVNPNYKTNLSINNTNSVYPEKITHPVTIGKLRQYIIVDIPVALFRYHPQSKILEKLVSYEAEIRVDLFSGSELGSICSLNSLDDFLGEERVKSLVSNYDQISNFYHPGSQKRSVSDASSQYVIMTTQEIVNLSKQLNSFVELKKQQGFSTEVITESQWGGGTGDTASENIRSWLKGYYLEKNIQYVLLIGNPDPDVGNVPMKMLWPRNNREGFRNDINAPSDFYYSELTGNWDKDKDGKFGEYKDDDSDRFYEVIVGRIPFYGNREHLDGILKKTIAYQKETSGFWRSKMLIAIKPDNQGDPFEYHLGETIRTEILSDNWDFYRIYDEHYDLVPEPEHYPCTKINVSNAIKNNRFGFFIWWSHGSETDATYITDINQVKQFDNAYPFFTFQNSCLNASPEHPENLAFAILRNGAITTVASTRKSWFNRGERNLRKRGTNSSIAFHYTEKLISQMEITCGMAIHALKEENMIRNHEEWMNYLVMCLYGDPSASLYSWQRFQCEPPLSGDWIITESCALHQSCQAPANVIVKNNAVLTIPKHVSLDIDLINFNLTVEKGSGVFVENGGAVK